MPTALKQDRAWQQNKTQTLLCHMKVSVVIISDPPPPQS